MMNDDIRKYCTEMQIAQLSVICETISSGRMDEDKPLNTYYVCNIDKPYAEKMLQMIYKASGM